MYNLFYITLIDYIKMLNLDFQIESALIVNLKGIRNKWQLKYIFYKFFHCRLIFFYRRRILHSKLFRVSSEILYQ